MICSCLRDFVSEYTPIFTLIAGFLPNFIFCHSTYVPRPIKQFPGSAAAWSNDRVEWQPDMTGVHVAIVCVCFFFFQQGMDWEENNLWSHEEPEAR